MIRKFAAVLVALVIAVGTVFAEEIKGTFVKFADGKLTVKVDDKEKELKVPTDLKVKGKGGTEVSASDALAKYKEGQKMIIEEDGGTVKSFKRDRSK